MTREQREELKRLKSEASSAKRELLALARRVEAISPRQGEQLVRILERLESWQNR